MARPNKGSAHVAKVQGDEVSKWRVAVILSTMPATRTVAEACHELGIGQTHFGNLRTQALQGAVEGLLPRPIGRPRHATLLTAREVDDLQRENEVLRRENELLRTQLEVAVALQESSGPKRPMRGPRARRRAVP
jgi:transposase-like protein